MRECRWSNGRSLRPSMCNCKPSKNVIDWLASHTPWRARRSCTILSMHVGLRVSVCESTFCAQMRCGNLTDRQIPAVLLAAAAAIRFLHGYIGSQQQHWAAEITQKKCVFKCIPHLPIMDTIRWRGGDWLTDFAGALIGILSCPHTVHGFGAYLQIKFNGMSLILTVCASMYGTLGHFKRACSQFGNFIYIYLWK